jgi:hypothetical protein
LKDIDSKKKEMEKKMKLKMMEKRVLKATLKTITQPFVKEAMKIKVKQILELSREMLNKISIAKTLKMMENWERK